MDQKMSRQIDVWADNIQEEEWMDDRWEWMIGGEWTTE